MGRLDWAVNLGLHADDVAPLDAAALAAAQIAPDHLVLVPHPSLSLIRLDYPADRIWRAVLADDDQTLAALELKRGPCFVLV